MPRSNVTGYQGNFLPSVALSIALGATESDAHNLAGFSLTGLILPPLFTGTALTFLVADSIDGFQAQAEIVFTGIPANGNTVVINGTTITFVTGTPSGNQVQIGASAALTAAALQTFLAASTDANLILSTYSTTDTVTTLTAVLHGTAGNSYTLTKVGANISVSAATFSGGGFRPLYDSANAAVAMTVAAGRCYAVDPANFQGVPFLKIKSGTTETAARTIIATLKGI